MLCRRPDESAVGQCSIGVGGAEADEYKESLRDVVVVRIHE
jgi:hypothetical protein